MALGLPIRINAFAPFIPTHSGFGGHFIMSNMEALVNTKAGKLRGTQINGVYRFLGVHYAAPPTGKNRFLPPQPLTPWTGERSAETMVPKCWQYDEPRMEDDDITSTKYYKSYTKLMTGSSEMGVGQQTEDCLALNLWTSGLSDGNKRPVLVWFHGGGNNCGDAGAAWHDGYNLAKKQNIIVINVGHRLNVFGYLYLADFGVEKYKDCSNLGHKDMVAALQWVHDNIEAFGGDPDNVTIFGQSGGGNKVTSLMAMPSAKGLFHKAIIQSGGFMISPPQDGKKAALQLLEYLKIDVKHLDDLQKIPPEGLIAAVRAINKTRTLGSYLRFPSVTDGSILPGGPFDGELGTRLNRDMPIIVSYCKDDAHLNSLFSPEIYQYRFEDLPKCFEKHGYTVAQGKKIVEIYKKMLPEDSTPYDVYLAYLNDLTKLKQSEDWYQARKKVGCAPMYACVFCFEGPDSDLRAVHGVDVPFYFDTAIYAPCIWTVDTRVGAMQLSEDASAAWAAFARTGNPSHPGIPVWKPYDEENRYSMLIDVESRLADDYHKQGREVLYHIGI